jgi:AhpD family alkylhydroperoxidase
MHGQTRTFWAKLTPCASQAINLLVSQCNRCCLVNHTAVPREAGKMSLESSPHQ